MEEKQMNLVQKLAKIRETSGVVSKSKKGFGYTYADITDILANVTAGMKRYGVSLIPTIVPGTSHVGPVTIETKKVDKTGKLVEQVTTEMVYTADMVFRWVNDDDPGEVIEVPWFVTGSQSDPSQAMGGGLTYTQRQFLTAYFQIAQPDSDPDSYRTKQKEAERAEEKALASKITEEFDGVARLYLADHPYKRDELNKFVSRFVKNMDYTSITNPELAAKMLNEFRKTYIKEE